MPWKLVFCALEWPTGLDQGAVTYRLRSSSSLMMHVAPVLLHWAHSDSPSLTTHRILLSRHEAQAIEARCRICCLVDERDEGAGLEACSELALSLSPSERDLRFTPDMVAAVVIENACQCQSAEVNLQMLWSAPGFRFGEVVKRSRESGQQEQQKQGEMGKRRQIAGSEPAETRKRIRVC